MDDTTTANPDPLYTVAQAAAWLNISPNSVRNLVTDGELRAHRIRRNVRVPLSELHAYLERSTR
jgi:excisionase family DNA binding protein